MNNWTCILYRCMYSAHMSIDIANVAYSPIHYQCHWCNSIATRTSRDLGMLRHVKILESCVLRELLTVVLGWVKTQNVGWPIVVHGTGIRTQLVLTHTPLVRCISLCIHARICIYTGALRWTSISIRRLVVARVRTHTAVCWPSFRERSLINPAAT